MHESDELEDFKRLANDIFDESEDQFHGFYEPFEIYLMTRTMSLNSLKDSMSLQNAGNFEAPG